MRAKELKLEIFLQEYKNKSIDFYRFPGNYGDSLIWHGTKQLLSEFGIAENYVEINDTRRNKILFIDGGGNLVNYYSDVSDFLEKKPDLYDEIVILPHTIYGQAQSDVLNNVKSELTVFCREENSASFLEQNLNNGKLFLCDDCAFYNRLSKNSTGIGKLNAFRTDKESILKEIPDDNIDISSDGYAKKPLDEMLNKLRQYQEINTDRLHIGIAATMLGKDVKLYPNSYYKNRAVYDYSLKKYSNVTFIE